MTGVTLEKSNTNLAAISTLAIISLANIAFHSAAIENANASSDGDYNFAIAFDWHDCQQIDSAYQTVYAFETASFYVNICQKEDTYFYLGEAKQGDSPTLRSSIFIPAYRLENGSGFKADNGNLSYWVILPFSQQNQLQISDSERSEAILTIKRNNRLVSVESSLDKYCHKSETTVAWDTLELQPYDNNQIAAIPPQQDVGLEFSTHQSDRLLPNKTFNSQSRFDFYRIGGELHRLTTCD